VKRVKLGDIDPIGDDRQEGRTRYVGMLIMLTRRVALSVRARSPLATHTLTHPFNGPLSRTTRVSRYQKGKTNLDFTEARDSERQWHQLDHMRVCTALQTDNHQHPTTQFFTGRMPFLPPNQQRQSTEGNTAVH